MKKSLFFPVLLTTLIIATLLILVGISDTFSLGDVDGNGEIDAKDLYSCLFVCRVERSVLGPPKQ